MEKYFLDAKIAINTLEHFLKQYLTQINQENQQYIAKISELESEIKKLREEKSVSESPSE